MVKSGFIINDMIHVYLKSLFKYEIPKLEVPDKDYEKAPSQLRLARLIKEYYHDLYKKDKKYVNINLLETIDKKKPASFTGFLTKVKIHNEAKDEAYKLKCFADYEASIDFFFWNIKIIEEVLNHPDYVLSKKILPDGMELIGLPPSVIGDYDGEMIDSSLKLKSVKIKKPKRKRRK